VFVEKERKKGGEGGGGDLERRLKTLLVILDLTVLCSL
jgi:hypothetical protein